MISHKQRQLWWKLIRIRSICLWIYVLRRLGLSKGTSQSIMYFHYSSSISMIKECFFYEFKMLAFLFNLRPKKTRAIKRPWTHFTSLNTYGRHSISPHFWRYNNYGYYMCKLWCWYDLFFMVEYTRCRRLVKLFLELF